MRRGEESLRLELARRRAASDAERDAVPPPPPPARGTAGVVEALVEMLRGRRAEPAGAAP
jgi:hypothetical protein